MKYWNGGKNTPYHKPWHILNRLYCYIMGHNRFAMGIYDKENRLHGVDHCRRCEIVLVDGDERRHTPSWNLYVRWIMVRIKLLLFCEQHNVNLERVLFPFNRERRIK